MVPEATWRRRREVRPLRAMGGRPGERRVLSLCPGRLLSAGACLRTGPSPRRRAPRLRRSSTAPSWGRTELFGGTLGSSGIKTAEQAAIYGDTAGVAYGHHGHQACDTVANFSATGLDSCPTRPPSRWSPPPTAHAQRPQPRQGPAAPPCSSTTTSRRAGSPPDPTTSEGRWRTVGAAPPASQRARQRDAVVAEGGGSGDDAQETSVAEAARGTKLDRSGSSDHVARFGRQQPGWWSADARRPAGGG